MSLSSNPRRQHRFQPQDAASYCRCRAFTLVEMLVTLSVLSILLLVIFSIINQTSSMWTRTSRNVKQFQSARVAFQTLTRLLSEATLNTYYGVTYAGGKPTRYDRASDLHFVSGTPLATGLNAASGPGSQISHAVFFQAPLGNTDLPAKYGRLDSLLCVCGFYIQYAQEAGRPTFLEAMPSVPTKAWRFRLMQLVQPTESFPVYSNTTGNGWIKNMMTAPAAGTWVHEIADNVVALVIMPVDPTPAATSIAPNFDYDTRINGAIPAQMPGTLAQLPPVVEVVMVVIDEKSLLKLGNPATPPNFGQATLFKSAAMLEADLATLQANLNASPGNAAGNRISLESRVFRTRVALRGAKWTTE
ncbi:MAG: Verru_Chthon cassette protein C [Candidatus Methylacidiphilales bacterium]|nr:Verru_Chthon cassette protein C [Candidatus Methylacidiphilales bacterium]